MKILPLILIATALCVPGAAKTRHSANHRTISGSGCIDRGVENACRVIIDSQTGETYLGRPLAATSAAGFWLTRRRSG
jgi:hypothetical protein